MDYTQMSRAIRRVGWTRKKDDGSQRAQRDSKRVRQAIEARGCRLLFLLAYSPDFSPIDETFSQLKAFLRRAEAGTREALQEALAQSLMTVSAQDAHGWFEHGGYLFQKMR